MPKKDRLVYIKIKEGRSEIQGLGKWYSYWRDPYHLMLVVPWGLFLGIIALIYIVINSFFALLFLLGGDNIANAQPGSFFDAFFFSVQTFASIGYGAMYPKTFYGNLIVSIEAMVGLLSVALLTGIAFARFSRSTARIMFSKVAVVSNHGGALCLIIRTANERGNQILEAQVKMHLLRDELTEEGSYIRRIYDLKLLRERTYSFSLGWTIFHPIDEQSPFYQGQFSELANQNISLIITINGYDETVSQMVHAREDYGFNQILWGHRFVDIVKMLTNGDRVIDYGKFNQTQPVGD